MIKLCLFQLQIDNDAFEALKYISDFILMLLCKFKEVA